MMLTVEKVLLLGSVGFFAALPSEALFDVAAMFEEKSYAPGEPVIEKGALDTSMYVFVSGRVEVRDNGKQLAVLTRGQVFGELGALAPGPRTAAVVALEDALLLRLDHEALYELIADHEQLARNIIQHLVAEYRRMHASLYGDAKECG